MPCLPAQIGLVAFTLIGAALLAPPAGAQDYPSRPVTIVAGFAPGGPADALARLLAQRLPGELKQPVVVENKPGAGGTIGAAAVAAAKPDGYTLLLVTSGHAGSGALYAKLPYDPLKSFQPVIKLAASPVLVATTVNSPYNSLRDVIAAAKKSPGKINYAGGGGGATVTNLAAQFLKRDAGIDITEINYKGSGPAMMALLAGEIDVTFDIPSAILPQVKAGKLRTLATTTRTRSAFIPNVPTVAEEGVPNFEVLGWFGVMVPQGTPPAVVNRLNAEINKVLALPEVKTTLTDMGLDVGGGTPAEFADLVANDTKRAGDAIRRLGLTPN